PAPPPPPPVNHQRRCCCLFRCWTLSGLSLREAYPDCITAATTTTITMDHSTLDPQYLFALMRRNCSALLARAIQQSQLQLQQQQHQSSSNSAGAGGGDLLLQSSQLADQQQQHQPPYQYPPANGLYST